MARNIKQFRWYGEDDERNSPKATINDYTSGGIFENYFPMSQLGVQGIPGTKIYLNGSTRPIVMGVSGIYDLDIKNGARITGLSFDKDSLQKVKDWGGYLIVDFLYGEEDK